MPLNDAFRANGLVSRIKLNFWNLEGTGSVYFDSIYIGDKNSLPLQDSLFFGFTNTAEDRERYSTLTYGNNNYDTGSWAVNTTRNTKPVFGSNALSIQIAATTDNYAATGVTPFIQTTDASGALANAALNYIPHEDDYVQVRFSMKDCAVSTGNPALRFYFGTDSSGAMSGSITRNLSVSDLTSEKYITVTMPLSEVEAYRSAELVRVIRLTFPNVRQVNN